MKKSFILLSITLLTLTASGEVIFDLFNDDTLYNQLEGQAGPVSYANNGISATFTSPGGTMHRTTSGGFGIDAIGSDDTTFAIDSGESLQISFDQDITITGLDFRNFESGESINIIIGSTTNKLTEMELDNRTSDYEENLSWQVSSTSSIRFEVIGSTDAIAIDSITVIPEPATAGLLVLSGIATLFMRRMLH